MAKRYASLRSYQDSGKVVITEGFLSENATEFKIYFEQAQADHVIPPSTTSPLKGKRSWYSRLNLGVFGYLLTPFFFIELAFFYVGIRGLATRKPFLYSSKWISGLMAFFFASQVFYLAPQLISSSGISLTASFYFVFYLIFVIFSIYQWLSFAGYTFMGTTDESFRDALHAALKKSNLTFEEKLTRIQLTNLGAELKVMTSFSYGSGMLIIKPRKHRDVLNLIAWEMSIYFRSNPVKTNMTAFVLYLIFSFLIIPLIWFLIKL
jgi:hypothetical protein